MSASTLIYRCGRRRREQWANDSLGSWLLSSSCGMVYNLLQWIFGFWDGFLSKTEFFGDTWSDVTYKLHDSSCPARSASRVLMVQLRRLPAARLQNQQLTEVLSQTQRRGAARELKQFTWSNTWENNSSWNWECGSMKKQIQVNSKSSFICFVGKFILPKVFQYLSAQRELTSINIVLIKHYKLCCSTDVFEWHP